MKGLIYTVFAILGFGLGYGICVFVSWQPNPADWYPAWRFIGLAFSIAMGAFSTAIPASVLNDE